MQQLPEPFLDSFFTHPWRKLCSIHSHPHGSWRRQQAWSEFLGELVAAEGLANQAAGWGRKSTPCCHCWDCSFGFLFLLFLLEESGSSTVHVLGDTTNQTLEDKMNCTWPRWGHMLGWMPTPARLGQLVLAPELESSATDMRARGHLNGGGRSRHRSSPHELTGVGVGTGTHLVSWARAQRPPTTLPLWLRREICSHRTKASWNISVLNSCGLTCSTLTAGTPKPGPGWSESARSLLDKDEPSPTY